MLLLFKCLLLWYVFFPFVRFFFEWGLGVFLSFCLGAFFCSLPIFLHFFFFRLVLTLFLHYWNLFSFFFLFFSLFYLQDYWNTVSLRNNHFIVLFLIYIYIIKTHKTKNPKYKKKKERKRKNTVCPPWRRQVQVIFSKKG